MNAEKKKIFIPETPDAVARFFRECARLRGEGKNIQAAILESPFRPGLRAGIPTDTSRLESISGARIPVFHDVEDLIPALVDGSPGTVYISHDRMKRIHEISSSDLLAVVDGGVRLGELIDAVKDANLYSPLESSYLPADTTIAELIMSGAIVSTEGRFGSQRESVLSVELITPAGETVHQGSRSVKDVGGYEIIGFLMGSGGSCGLISKVTLRLHPRPQCRTFFAAHGSLEELEGLARRIHQSCSPTFLDIFEREAARILVDRWEAVEKGRGEVLPAYLRDESCGDCVLVGELQGLESVVEEQLHGLVSEGTTCEASLVLVKPFLIEELRRYPFLDWDTPDEREYFHITFDGASADLDIPDSLVYRNLYPMRSHIYLKSSRITNPGPIEALIPLFTSVIPDLNAFLGIVARSDIRVRIGLISLREYGQERFEIPKRDFTAAVKKIEGPFPQHLKEYISQSDVQEQITQRILAVFDPDRIMLP